VLCVTAGTGGRGEYRTRRVVGAGACKAVRVSVPSGTVTFLFTDIEGSTRLWESAPSEMRTALTRHDALLRAAIGSRGGYVFSTGGDGFAAAFDRPQDAVRAALDAHLALDQEPWPTTPIRVRMAVHTGVADERDGNYFGPTLNRAARLMAAGSGGQILCSSATAQLLEGVTLIDLGEHRLRDLSASQEIYQIGAGNFPPLRSLQHVPTNLPVLSNALIGRGTELAEVTELAESRRAVTLTGPGGVGKTRLALAVGAELTEAFPDGCWLVDLAAVASADLARAVASAIRTGSSDFTTLADYLGQRRTLIVLDNCEHVADQAATFIEAVLAAGAEPTFLSTSRVVLGVEGEAVYTVSPLPSPERNASRQELLRSPAVRLFVERAASGGIRTDADDDSLESVGEICRGLDGIPLAIEIAAVRTRALRPADIVARLGERLSWSHRATDRRTTLQATVEWSHGLLDVSEQVVFRRLGIFPAEFDLDAAVAIAGETMSGATESVVRLVDCSLLVFHPETGRYRMLETLRLYARERLAEAGEVEAIRGCHMAYYLGLARRLGAGADTATATATADDDTRRMLTYELDNLRTAAEWCCERGDWRELADMLLAIRRFLFSIVPTEYAAWAGQVAEHGAEFDRQTLVDILGELAWLASAHFADDATTTSYVDQCLKAAATPEVLGSPMVYAAIAERQLKVGAFQEMLTPLGRALQLAEARNDQYASCIAYGYLAMAHAALGQDAASDQHDADALRLAKQSGYRETLLGTMSTSAMRRLWSADPDFAAGLNVLANYDRLPPGDGELDSWIEGLRGAALAGLQDSRAGAHVGRAVQLADRLGSANALDVALRAMALVAGQAGRLTESAMLVGYSDTHLATYPRDASFLPWLELGIREALPNIPDRSDGEAKGAQASRLEILAVIDQLTAELIAPPNSDPHQPTYR
jgi:predicted ATPase/class 3 adenylate cyclase